MGCLGKGSGSPSFFVEARFVGWAKAQVARELRRNELSRLCPLSNREVWTAWATARERTRNTKVRATRRHPPYRRFSRTPNRSRRGITSSQKNGSSSA
jgi:hypothetical protein